MGSDDTNPKKDHGTKRKTPFQLQTLERLYSEEKYPEQREMEEYAASLKLTYKQIRTWFVERRRKERREDGAPGSGKKNTKGGSLGLETKNNYPGLGLGKSLCKGRYGGTVEPGSARSDDNSRAHANHDMRASKESRAALGKKKKKGLGQKNGVQTTRYELSHASGSAMLKKKLAVGSSIDWHCKHGISKVLRQQLKTGADGRVCCTQRGFVHLQVLFSKDYILKRVFRKDGPPLGVEFDSLPEDAFGRRDDCNIICSYQDSPRTAKRRKVLESPIVNPRAFHGRHSPPKKYGIGKGLMTVWRATNPYCRKVPAGLTFIDGRASWMPFRSNASTKEKLYQVSKSLQQRKLVPKQRTWEKKKTDKRKSQVKKRKVPYVQNARQKRSYPIVCKLLLDEKKPKEQSSALGTLLDDEELELGELQAGPNPLRCSAHLSRRNGCPLCQDLLSRFPPQLVLMKQPLSTRPWDSSPELVKKLFKVFRFLYTHAQPADILPFTLDELAQAFHDKDSLLLGQIHVALLKVLLLDVEREMAAGYIHRASKSCRFLGFLHFVMQQEFDVSFWSRSLNPLTWTEILRMVLVAAGFGSRQNTVRRDTSNKERSRMAKYGLQPRTLKGELFSILSERGSGGLRVSEMAKTSQIVSLEHSSTIGELEQAIHSTLSSDITLFEKIAPSAYRLRVDPHIKGREDSQSESDDSGSVDDDTSDACSSSSSEDSDDSEEFTLSANERRIVNSKQKSRKKSQKLAEHTEIDESYSGEAWVLGLMEGEYSDLSIEEKLDALVALIDLAAAGSNLGMEESERAISTVIHDNPYHGSGAKIKKSSANNLLLSHSSTRVPSHVGAQSSLSSFTVDTSAISPVNSGKQHSKDNKCTFEKVGGFGAESREATRETVQDMHPVRSIYLGSDRRYNSYWLFLGPCNANDPGHRRVYFESSEDGHWEVIDTSQALQALLSVLDCRGLREAHLFASLEKREVSLCEAMDEYVNAECRSRQRTRCDQSELGSGSGDGSSPISDVDNVLFPTEFSPSSFPASGAIVLELGKNYEEKKQRWERMQAFDKWIWHSFYRVLNAVKYSKRSYMESLARCEDCHDLYWRDEKHCRICHTTFEVDFDLEERYAIHVATCREADDSNVDSGVFPKHKVLPSQLQALKAAIYAIESGMPETALVVSWTRSAHNLWVKRLRRTSSLPELLQVLADFVGAINEGWLYASASPLASSTALDEIVIYFQTMPQTTSALALWMFKLDTLIGSHLERLHSGRTSANMPEAKRRRICSR